MDGEKVERRKEGGTRGERRQKDRTKKGPGSYRSDGGEIAALNREGKDRGERFH